MAVAAEDVGAVPSAEEYAIVARDPCRTAPKGSRTEVNAQTYIERDGLALPLFSSILLRRWWYIQADWPRVVSYPCSSPTLVCP